MENETNLVFSCYKYDNIQRKAFNEIIKLMTSIFEQEIIENKTFICQKFFKSSEFIWLVLCESLAIEETKRKKKKEIRHTSNVFVQFTLINIFLRL